MAGMINAPSPTPSGGGLSNPLLQQTETAIEARLKPETRRAYITIVVAGLQIALAKGPDSFAAKLHTSTDPIGDAAKGSAQLVLIMKKEAKGVMPTQAMIPAGLTLLLHALDFIDHAGIVTIAEPELDRGVTVFSNEMFRRLGITPQMLQHATAAIHGIVQDPAKMELINRKAGVVKSPDASEPTPGLAAS